jgi:hypothetical protein
MPSVTMDFCGPEAVMKLMRCKLRERSTSGRTFQKLTVLLFMLQPKPDGKFRWTMEQWKFYPKLKLMKFERV